jgi:hypothetical protein
MGEQVRLAVGQWPDVWRDGMGGADGEVGKDVVAKREGEGKARRGQREGQTGGGGWPDGKGAWPDGKRAWPDGKGAWPDGKGGWPDGIGTLPDRGGVARRDGVECQTGICGGWTGWEGVRMGRT